MRVWATRPARSPGRAGRWRLGLGIALARRGALAAISLGLAGVGALSAVIAAAVLSRHGSAAAMARVPTVTAEAVAWIAGLTLAFGAGMRAWHHPEEAGAAALARCRGASSFEYARARVAGLVLLVAGAVGGATLVAGVAAIVAAAGGGGSSAWGAVRTSAAALAYALAFAATIGPLTMAALGASTRVGGYLTLLAVLVVPEIASPWTAGVLPRGWHELTSIPAALDAIRAGWSHPMTAGAAAGRATAGLAAVVAVSLVVVAVRAARTEAELRP